MTEQVALFWDFENIHASVMNHDYGQNWFKNYKFKPQPNVVDVKAIVNYASGLGDLVLNRAYANWQWMHKYASALNETAVELVQLFPRGHQSKNAADMLLSIDIIDYINLLPNISVVVLVSGDGDFIPIGKRVRRQGKKIIGLGVKETSNDFWIKTCNEFKFYGNIISRPWSETRSTGEEEIDTEDARSLILQAMQQLSKSLGDEWVEQVRIKPMMVRLDPAFDEQSFGFSSFSHFIRKQTDILEYRHRKGKQESEYRIRAGVERLPSHGPTEEIQDSTLALYTNILKDQKIKLPTPGIIEQGIAIYNDMIREQQQFELKSLVDRLCFDRLQRYELDATLTDAKKLRHLFYKCFIFRQDAETGAYSFHEDVSPDGDLLDRLLRLFLKRIGDNIDDGELDTKVISTMICGDPQRYELQLQALLGEESNGIA